MGFFFNPALLIGLALAAAPIIIHFLNKRKFEVHEWAAMDFLFQASIINRRRVKLEDLLLLLLRTLLIIFLVLVVARPLIKGLGDWSEDQRLVIFDDSFSIDRRTPTGSTFDLARETAVNQVQDAVGRSVPVDIRLGSRPHEAGLNLGPSGEKDSGQENQNRDQKAQRSWEILESIREIQPSDRPIELAQILERLVEEVDSEEASHKRSVVLVSDFRRVDWFEGESSQFKPELRAAFEKIRDKDLSDRLGFHLIDLGRPATDNVTVTDVKISSKHPTIGVGLKIQVEIANFSKTLKTHINGSIEMAPAQSTVFKATKRLSLPPVPQIPPGERVTVEIETKFEEADTYLVRAVLEEDSLPRDDESFAVIHVKEGLEVLLVDGDPSPDRFGGEADYLLAALSPRGNLPSGVKAKKISGIIKESDLDNIDVLFLLNKETLQGQEKQLVENFVSDGGGLAYFLGNKVNEQNYASFAKPPKDGPENEVLFPATLGKLKKEIKGVALLPKDMEHGAFSIFKGLEGSPMNRKLFQSFNEIAPHEVATISASYNDTKKTPGIIEAPYGDGKIAIFNTTADRDASDWPTDPSFVIVLQEWVRYLAPQYSSKRNLTVGEPLRWRIRPGFKYAVYDPKGKRHEVEAEETTSGSVLKELSFPDTALAGFYRLEESWPGGAQRSTEESSNKVTWFASRRVEQESILTPIGAGKLESALDGYGIRYALGKETKTDAFQNEQEGEIWRWLAYAVGGILLLELFLAWWFGRK